MKWMLPLLMLALGACIVHGHGHRHERVVVGHDHGCDSWCDHYHHRGHWYVIHQHRHGPGCGHVFVSGRWTLR